MGGGGCGGGGGAKVARHGAIEPRGNVKVRRVVKDGNVVENEVLDLDNMADKMGDFSWSLISLVNLIAFLFFQYSTPAIGIHSRQRASSSWFLLVFPLLVLLSHAVFHIILAIQGDLWTGEVTQWEKLLGLMRVQSGKGPSAIVFLLVHIAIALIAVFDNFGSSCHLEQWSYFPRNLKIGLKLRVACCLLLSAIQLLVGISHPSWISLPFFISSCIGLVDWSLTSNFSGLFWWWRYLLLYAGLNIVLIYIYQLPIEFSGVFQWFAEFIGLYKISSQSDWSETCSGTSLLFFYIVLSCVRYDLAEMDVTMSMKRNNLTESLLPSSDSFHIHPCRSGIWHCNFLFKGAAFRIFTINFFTYGFPVRLSLMYVLPPPFAPFFKPIGSLGAFIPTSCLSHNYDNQLP